MLDAVGDADACLSIVWISEGSNRTAEDRVLVELVVPLGNVEREHKRVVDVHRELVLYIGTRRI